MLAKMLNCCSGGVCRQKASHANGEQGWPSSDDDEDRQEPPGRQTSQRNKNVDQLQLSSEPSHQFQNANGNHEMFFNVPQSPSHNIPSIRTENLSTASFEDCLGRELTRKKSASVCANVPSSRQSSNSSCTQDETFCQISSLDSPLTDKPGINRALFDNNRDNASVSSKGSAGKDEPVADMKETASGQRSLTLSVKSYHTSGGSRRLSDMIQPEMIQPELYKTDTLPTDSSSQLRSQSPLLTPQSPKPTDLGSVGQVHFSLRYDIPNEVLTLKMVEARDLTRPGRDPNTSNPYIKVCLLPERKLSRQTTVKRKTSSPLFDEVFQFDIPYHKCIGRSLYVAVIDFDRVERNHCVLGVCDISLADIDLLKGGHFWRNIYPPPADNKLELGEILLSLQYLPTAQQLNVDILKASGLLQTDLIGGCDPFVKVALVRQEKVLKNKQTAVRADSLDPVFNESFHFNVTPKEIDECSVIVSVWDKNSKSRDDFVGRIILGNQPSGEDERIHWNRMKKSPREFIPEWHTLKSKKDCDAVSKASTLLI